MFWLLLASYGGSLYPQWNSGSPRLIASCTMTSTARTTEPCTTKLWRNIWLNIPHIFNLLLSVSCLFRTRCCMNSVICLLVNDLGHLICRGASPMYPSSASTLSPRPRWAMRESLKMEMSGQAPHGYGPLIHTQSPVWIHTPSSYLNPLFFLNLWLENLGPWFGTRKSTPSQESRQSAPTSPLNRLAQTICMEATGCETRRCINAEHATIKDAISYHIWFQICNCFYEEPHPFPNRRGISTTTESLHVSRLSINLHEWQRP